MLGSDFKGVIATDDLQWVWSQPVFDGMLVIHNDLPETDMGILAACPYMVMSIGTFGWWAAYLRGGVLTFYYATPFIRPLNYSDHFLPNWVSISDEDIAAEA